MPIASKPNFKSLAIAFADTPYGTQIQERLLDEVAETSRSARPFFRPTLARCDISLPCVVCGGGGNCEIWNADHVPGLP